MYTVKPIYNDHFLGPKNSRSLLTTGCCSEVTNVKKFKILPQNGGRCWKVAVIKRWSREN